MAGIPDEIMELLNKINKTDDECHYVLDWFRNNKELVNKALVGKPLYTGIEDPEAEPQQSN